MASGVKAEVDMLISGKMDKNEALDMFLKKYDKHMAAALEVAISSLKDKMEIVESQMVKDNEINTCRKT